MKAVIHSCALCFSFEKKIDRSIRLGCAPIYSLWKVTLLLLPQFMKTLIFDQRIVLVMTYGAKIWVSQCKQ